MHSFQGNRPLDSINDASADFSSGMRSCPVAPARKCPGCGSRKATRAFSPIFIPSDHCVPGIPRKRPMGPQPRSRGSRRHGSPNCHRVAKGTLDIDEAGGCWRHGREYGPEAPMPELDPKNEGNLGHRRVVTLGPRTRHPSQSDSRRMTICRWKWIDHCSVVERRTQTA